MPPPEDTDDLLGQVEVSFDQAIVGLKKLLKETQESQEKFQNITAELEALVGDVSKAGDEGEVSQQLLVAAKVLKAKDEEFKQMQQNLRVVARKVPKHPKPLGEVDADEAPWAKELQELFAGPEDASGPDVEMSQGPTATSSSSSTSLSSSSASPGRRRAKQEKQKQKETNDGGDAQSEADGDDNGEAEEEQEEEEEEEEAQPPLRKKQKGKEKEREKERGRGANVRVKQERVVAPNEDDE